MQALYTYVRTTNVEVCRWSLAVFENDDRGKCNRVLRVKEPVQMTSAKFRRVWTMRRLDIDGTAQTITVKIDVCIRTYDKREHLPLAEQRNSARCRNCHFNSGRSPGRHLHRRHLASKLNMPFQT